MISMAFISAAVSAEKLTTTLQASGDAEFLAYIAKFGKSYPNVAEF